MLIDVLNKVQYRHIASVSVAVSAEAENVVSAAVSVAAVTGKSSFGRSLIGMFLSDVLSSVDCSTRAVQKQYVGRRMLSQLVIVEGGRRCERQG